MTASSMSARGKSQAGLRLHNERLVLTLLHYHGALAQTQIARMTGLSAQTVSVIMRALAEDGMILRGQPVRGRVGQPSVPISLNPEGAFFFGVKVGRRSAEVVLTDLFGRVRGERRSFYPYPCRRDVEEFVGQAVREISADCTAAQRDRIRGLGIAIPFWLWDWPEIIGVDTEKMADWRDADLKALLASQVPFPVYLQNDASAACGAELIFGETALPNNFLHIYLGYFVGGGVVLDGRLHTGPNGNAGALGSMPVTGATGPRQLVEVASIYALEQRLAAHGAPVELTDRADWPIPDRIAAIWLDETADGIAQAITAACAVLDLPAVVLDGWLPARLRHRLAERLDHALDTQNFTGIRRPALIEGSLGRAARSLGAAALPMTEQVLLDASAIAKAE